MCVSGSRLEENVFFCKNTNMICVVNTPQHNNILLLLEWDHVLFAKCMHKQCPSLAVFFSRDEVSVAACLS